MLGALLVFSTLARLAYLDKPSSGNGQNPALIFDEQYYVNAARVILGIHPPAGNIYANAALFHDPNAEHPPLVKLLIASTMRLYGDNPVGWRIGAVIFGSLAILGIYWLVRAARGRPWLAVGAATLMAVDNLLLVHARIATLDIFVVTFMIAAVALYLTDRRVLSGIAIGIGLCTKFVAVDVVVILVLVEVGRLLIRHEGELRTSSALAARRLLLTTGVGLVSYLGVLYALDLWVAPVGAPGSCPTVAGGFHDPISHTRFMVCYAGKLTSPSGPSGIASYPWQWLLNQQPITYYNVSTSVTSGGKVTMHTVVSFLGEMNPAIIFLALPALGLAVHNVRQHHDTLSLLSVAWFVGTFAPFVLAAAPLGPVGNRTSYLYYMVIVLPAVYIAVAGLFSRRRFPPAALMGYVAIVGYWFVTLYPIRTWTGS